MTLFTTVALQRLQLCPAEIDSRPCGKAFVKMTQKRFCSTRCQARMYIRETRAKQRPAGEAFKKAIKKGTKR